MPHQHEFSALELKEKIANDLLDNISRRRGFALIAALRRSEYRKGRIPGSLHILPLRLEEECERRFEFDKELVIYSSSAGAARELADQLSGAGFSVVHMFAGDMREWQEAGYDVTAEASLSGGVQQEQGGGATEIPIEEGLPIFKDDLRRERYRPRE